MVAMEQKAHKILMLSAALAIQLFSSGCIFGGGGGGGGLFSLFGGGGGSSEAALLISGSSGSNDGQQEGGQEEPGGLGEELSSFSSTGFNDSPINDVPQVAVLHNPEPASMILFGSGLAGLGFLRRRRLRKASK